MVEIAAPMIAAEMQVDLDPSSQTEVRLVAPFAEVLMAALMVWKFLMVPKEVLPEVEEFPKVLPKV